MYKLTIFNNYARTETLYETLELAYAAEEQAVESLRNALSHAETWHDVSMINFEQLGPHSHKVTWFVHDESGRSGHRRWTKIEVTIDQLPVPEKIS